MFLTSASRLLVVLAVAGAGVAGALADSAVPLTFDCSVCARIVSGDPLAPGEWVQYGTNSASVTYGHKHADIAFTSATAAASLHAFTSESLNYNSSVFTIAPSYLTIGTTPELPAGTPLVLSFQVLIEWIMPPEFTLDLNRGTTSVIHVTQENMPWGGATVTASVVAGETLDVGFSQFGRGTDFTATFTATAPPPVPGACCLPGYTCQVVVPLDCGFLGGNWLGAGTTCNQCPPAPTGACCANYTCAIMTQAACGGGIYKGDGTSCTPLPCICHGDMNCDRQIGYADINPFVQALACAGGVGWPYPNCAWLNADINGDGVVSFADINPFVAMLYVGGPCHFTKAAQPD